MSSKRRVPFIATIAVVSFFYTYQSLRRHSLSERPRLSSCLLLFLSGIFCYVLSFLVSLFPSATSRPSSKAGRVHRRTESRDGPLLAEDVSLETLLEGSSAHMPVRPARWALPVLVACIAARLELFHYVSHRQQCSMPGVESFLCLILMIHEIFASRTRWGWGEYEDPDEPNNPWRGLFDDLYDWFSDSSGTMVLVLFNTFLFALGTCLSLNTGKRSTVVCFEPVDSRSQVVLVQIAGMLLDSTSIVLTWRIIAWARNLRFRLRAIAAILVSSAALMSVLGLGRKLLSLNSSGNPSISLGSMYASDIFADSGAFTCLIVSLSLWVCESSPLVPASVMTFAVGFWSAGESLFSSGDWLHLSPLGSLVHLLLVGFGAIFFTYFHNLQSIVFIPRIIFTLAILILLTAATVTYITLPPEVLLKHPVHQLTIGANLAFQKWSSHVSVSGSLKVAAQIYEERHGGRIPPPKFDVWYEYAKETAVIDEFLQIERDLGIFWSVDPSSLRHAAEYMISQPDVASISIKNGQVSHSRVDNSAQIDTLEDLATMIAKFSKHLPDMILPINLSPTPRVLHSTGRTHGGVTINLQSVSNLMSKRSSVAGSGLANSQATTNTLAMRTTSTLGEVPSVSEYRRMLLEACPYGSSVRLNSHWNVGEFCESCASPHSEDQIMSRFDASLDVCSQPDLAYQHGLYLTKPPSPPFRDLLPLFSPAKTDAFSDIVIPVPATTIRDVDSANWPFDKKYDGLFWRVEAGNGEISDSAVRGSQKFRLLHLLRTPRPHEQVTVVLPWPGFSKRLRHEVVSAAEADVTIPVSITIGNLTDCHGENCALLEQAYGFNQDDNPGRASDFRYVLEVDEDGGPSPTFLQTLKSHSVPFLSTIFRTWYTDRLTPWLHFVPIDPRYQALHTTYSYFTGTEDRMEMNGRETNLKGQSSEGEYIAMQGRNWAMRVLNDRHMEVYWFRLLIEWGRLVDDRREEIGFRIDEGGK